MSEKCTDKYIYNHRGVLVLRKLGAGSFIKDRTVVLQKGMNVVKLKDYELLNKKYVDLLVDSNCITVTDSDVPVHQKQPKKNKKAIPKQSAIIQE